MNTAQHKPTELQQLVEDMRIAQLHLTNLLSLAAEHADDQDQVESILAAANKYCQDDYCLWEQIEAIALADAKAKQEVEA